MSFTLEEEVWIIHVDTQRNLVQHVTIEVVDDYEKVESQHWKIANRIKRSFNTTLLKMYANFWGRKACK